MIYFDVTKTAGSRHASGLVRVTQRLRTELGTTVTPVSWSTWNRHLQRDDWFLTAELFSEVERPGFSTFLAERRGRTAAVFHDAIPLQFPHITWPQSVARQPVYMKLLGQFDHVFSVSHESCRALEGFWRWQGVTPRASLEVLTLGSDFDGADRGASESSSRLKSLVCVGIIEPRKNQDLLLDVAAALWDQGLDFELHVVGRVNPHFGRPIVKRMKTLARRHRGLRFHEAPTDAVVAKLIRNARALVFPTIAEGCGLPLLEALWRGVPVVCSDLPVLRENTVAGGCLALPVNDRAAWIDGVRRILTDDTCRTRLAAEAASRPLPTWRACADAILAALSRSLD
jgi:glycosyltransferase involved in cell wall biosynthesis